jgi:hypothetical protein
MSVTFLRRPIAARGKKLTGTASAVLDELCYAMNWKTFEVQLRWTTLLKSTGLSRSSVSRGLEELSKHGLIERVGHNRYYVFFHDEIVPSAELDHDERVPRAELDSSIGGTDSSAGGTAYKVSISDTNSDFLSDGAGAPGNSHMKFTQIRKESAEEELQKPRTVIAESVSKDRTGLSTGIAAKLDKQREKRNSLTPDAEAMAKRLETLSGRPMKRTGADRTRWNNLAAEYPGPRGLELVEAAFKNQHEMEWSNMAMGSWKVEWYAYSRFNVESKKQAPRMMTLAERLKSGPPA